MLTPHAPRRKLLSILSIIQLLSFGYILGLLKYQMTHIRTLPRFTHSFFYGPFVSSIGLSAEILTTPQSYHPRIGFICDSLPIFLSPHH